MMKRAIAILAATLIIMNMSAQGKMTDLRDGNTYKTITLAGKTWMTENLKYVAEESGAYFDNDPNNIHSYGVLYGWHAASKACPDGWRLPSGNEFRQLLDYIDNAYPGSKVKSGPVFPGFQLAGMKNYEGVFSEMDESGYYWTATEYNENEAEYFSYIIMNGKSMVDISRREDMPDIHGAEKSNKYSVRCVKNEK